MDPVFWRIDDQSLRLHSRVRNTLGRATLTKVDDTQGAQYHQIESHVTEVRDDLQRLGNVGFGSVPLPGASAVILWPTGHRGYGVVIGVEDGRYRPTGSKPGESHVSMIDGAKSDGSGGTLRKLSEGLIGWIHSITGKTINVGDADAVTINIGTTAKSVTLNFGSSKAAVNITGATGDVKVNGVSLVNHTHGGVMTGGGNTAAPNQS
jgi:phage baseplate assembly protein V